MASLAPSRADEWMSGAVDCLEFLPDELVVEVSRGLAGCADDLPQCKRLLYEVLAKHYGHAQRPPLFSNHVFDIHSGISELLGKLLRQHRWPLRHPAVILILFLCCQSMGSKRRLWRPCSSA